MAERIKTIKRIANIPEKYLFPVLALIAFFMPLYSPVSDALTYLVLMFFILQYISKRQHNLQGETKRYIYLGISLFFITVLQLIRSANRSEVLAQMDQFTAILVFPLLLALVKPDNGMQNKLFRVMNFAVAGTIISTWVLMIAAFMRFLRSGDNTTFYYISLGNGIHPSYLSMVVVIAIAILLDGKTARRFNKYSGPLTVICAGAILWLLVFNTLLSSKAGIIVQTIVLTLFIVKEFSKRDFRKAGILLVLLIISIVMIPLVFPNTYKRFVRLNDSIHATIAESPETSIGGKNSRLLGWQASMELIKQYPVLGVGPGNSKEKLAESYNNHGLSFGHRNSHNQFLQTWIELGLPGLIILLSLAVIPTFLAIRERNYLHLAILAILFIHMFFESTLERRLGVMIFAFWSTLLMTFYFYPPAQKKNESSAF